jgi:hypothetical protein
VSAYKVRPKSSVKGTRKQQQKRRYKQINYIGLENDPHPSQHTVGNDHQSF